MRLRLISSFVLLVSIGCSPLLPIAKDGPRQAAQGDSAPRPRTYLGNARVEASADAMLDREEKAAVKALNRTLGREADTPGAPVRDSATTAALALRKSPVTVRVEPMSDADLRGVLGDNFFQLKDSYTDRLTELQRKIAQQRLSKAEKKELARGAKYLVQVADLRVAVLEVSSHVHSSSFNAQQTTLQTMAWTSMLLQVRRTNRVELDAEDYAFIKRSLERERRADAIAASMMAMLAAYQAVLNQGADPRALDKLAESTLEGVAAKPTVSDEEARRYVDEFGANVDVRKAKYETMMRNAYGDARYEKVYKARLDATFQAMEQAQAQPSAASAPLDANRFVPGQVQKGVGVANAVKNGDASGALDGAAKMLPADSKIGSSLAGLSALSKGDAKGAFDAAMNFVPGGPVKSGLGLAAKLLFGDKE
jgi:hypothetical protein